MLKTNNEEKILKAAREKWDALYYRETKIRITTDFSLETIEAREEWSKALKELWGDTKKIFQKLRQNKHFSSYAKVKRIHHPADLNYKKSWREKKKLKEVLQEENYTRQKFRFTEINEEYKMVTM